MILNKKWEKVTLEKTKDTGIIYLDAKELKECTFNPQISDSAKNIKKYIQFINYFNKFQNADA